MTDCGNVTVKKLPERVSVSEARQLLAELEPKLESDRPCLVFDCSDVMQIDSAGIEMLLRCMEEAIKRNGDVKLAALSPQVAIILEITRVDRLFEIFATPSDAVESFHRFPVEALQQAPFSRNMGRFDAGVGRTSS